MTVFKPVSLNISIGHPCLRILLDLPIDKFILWTSLSSKRVNLLIKHIWLHPDFKGRLTPDPFWKQLSDYWLFYDVPGAVSCKNLNYVTNLTRLWTGFVACSCQKEHTQLSLFQRHCFGLHSLPAVISIILRKLLISLATVWAYNWFQKQRTYPHIYTKSRESENVISLLSA